MEKDLSGWHPMCLTGNMIETRTNSGTRTVMVGKATTHVIHVTSNGRHANCGYNGHGRDLQGSSDLLPGESITGRLCGKCFKHYPKVEVAQ